MIASRDILLPFFPHRVAMMGQAMASTVMEYRKVVVLRRRHAGMGRIMTVFGGINRGLCIQ